VPSCVLVGLLLEDGVDEEELRSGLMLLDDNFSELLDSGAALLDCCFSELLDSGVALLDCCFSVLLDSGVALLEDSSSLLLEELVALELDNSSRAISFVSSDVPVIFVESEQPAKTNGIQRHAINNLSQFIVALLDFFRQREELEVQAVDLLDAFVFGGDSDNLLAAFVQYVYDAAV